MSDMTDFAIINLMQDHGVECRVNKGALEILETWIAFGIPGNQWIAVRSDTEPAPINSISRDYRALRAWLGY